MSANGRGEERSWLEHGREVLKPGGGGEGGKWGEGWVELIVMIVWVFSDVILKPVGLVCVGIAG